MTNVKAKVCMVGEEGVGKTSLIRRFVTGGFADEYLRTLGTMMSKKTVQLEGPQGPATVDMMLWDIVGRRDFVALVADAYFFKANGVVGVLDTTRRTTLEALQAWMEAVHREVGAVPMVILANKWDLEAQRQVSEADLRTLAQARGVLVLTSSAKTGENVEAGFRGLATALLARAGP